MSGAKDLTAPRPIPGRARRTLGSLRSGFGRLEIVEGVPELPVRIIRHCMGRRGSWVHVSGRGPLAEYECEREW